MRIIVPLLALALFAGCKGNAPAAEATGDAAAVASTAAATAMPAVATNARTTLKYAGSYAQTGADGKVTTLVLNADDTYSWTGADGKAVTGSLNWYKDGSTFLLDAAGGKAVFAVADGAVYKLANKDAPRSGFTADQMWMRAAK